MLPFHSLEISLRGKRFLCKAVLSKGSGDGEQQEPWGCSTSGGTSARSALGSVNKPMLLMLLMGFIESGPWAGWPPAMLLGVNSNRSQDVPTS